MISLQERTSQPGMTAVPAFLHALIRQVEPYPAAVQNARWTSWPSTAGTTRSRAGSGPGPEPERGPVYFTDPGLRDLRPEWEDNAPLLVSRLRAAMTRHGTEASWTALLARLREASPEFARLWEQESSIADCGSVPERFVHPVAGRLRLARLHLWAEPQEAGLVAVGYTPADVATAAKLPRLQALSTASTSTADISGARGRRQLAGHAG